MLRRLDDMPTGTIGFTAVGEVEDDDWEEAVEPVLRQRIAAGEALQLLPDHVRAPAVPSQRLESTASPFRQ